MFTFSILKCTRWQHNPLSSVTGKHYQFIFINICVLKADEYRYTSTYFYTITWINVFLYSISTILSSKYICSSFIYMETTLKCPSFKFIDKLSSTDDSIFKRTALFLRRWNIWQPYHFFTLYGKPLVNLRRLQVYKIQDINFFDDASLQ